MRLIDLNGDVGEENGDDAALIPLLSSASVACGGHAGDTETMEATVRLCLAHGVAVGAHPSFPDRPNFGRTAHKASFDVIVAWMVEQISSLQAVATGLGCVVQHVKPHGAIYNQCAQDAELAEAVVHAVKRVDPQLKLFGLPGGVLKNSAQRAGLRFVAEGFADRAYLPGGRLVPRSAVGAVIEDVDEVVGRALSLARGEPILAVDGSLLPLEVESICVHSDTPGAVRLTRRIREAFAQEPALKIGPV